VPQDDFLNLVVIARDDDADATEWLRRCRQLERAAHRERPVRWGPRTLDVDVVAVTESRDGRPVPVISDDPELTLPHPRAAQRAFVLLPWAEIDPAAELPGHGPVAHLVSGLDTTGIERVGRVSD
jgi:2-amino-4-hydroxy-6-hydroxymethyldihydropteridine diphosphokinase